MRKRFFSRRNPAIAVAVEPARRNAVLPALGLGAIVALTGALPARAAGPEPHVNSFEITPFGGYMAGGEFEDPADNTDRDLDASSSFGLIVNLTDEPWRHYELLYSSQGTELDGVTTLDMDVQYLQIGGTVSHPDARRFIPYIAASLGATRFSPDEAGLDDETKLSFSLGGGLRIPITDHIGLRFDARAFLTLLDTDSDLFCVSSGGSGTCHIRAKSDTFLQYAAALGVTIGF